MPVRTFIMGSCVSRDALSRLQPEFSVGDYVARQSVISAGTSVDATLLHAERISSPFQLRNLRGDLAGDAPTRLAHEAGAIDVVLWDLVDERQGVHRAGEGWFTNNWELRQTGAIADLASFELLRFGTDEHFDVWLTAAKRFAVALDQAGLLDRTIVVAPSLATLFDSGERVSDVAPAFADGYGDRFDRYADVLANDLRLTAVRPGRDEVRAGREHRWGPAPFHYSAETEGHTAAQIAAIVSERGWSNREKSRVGWSLQVAPGSASVDLKVQLEAKIAKHDFLVEAHAYDAAGRELAHTAVDWPYSQHVGANYRYLADAQAGEVLSVGPLALREDVAELRFVVRNWKDQLHTVRKVVGGLLARPAGLGWQTLPRARVN